MPKEATGATKANDGLLGYITIIIEINAVVVPESQIPSVNLTIYTVNLLLYVLISTSIK